jgi:tetratricopeptide (TPR) repeat protein
MNSPLKILENIIDQDNSGNSQSQKKEETKKIEENRNNIKESNNNDNNSIHLKKILNELNEINISGENLFKKKLYDKAISKYEEGYEKIKEELSEINRDRTAAYQIEIQYFISLAIKLMSNLSLAYIQKDKYKESIEVDNKIISLDPKYDKSYERLFNSYLKMNRRVEAVFFGDILIKNFSNDVREKYKEIIPKIENEKKKMEAEYEIEKENKKAEARKNFLKVAIPLFVILISVIYMRYFKKN